MTGRDRWTERGDRAARRRGADDVLIRQVVGYAARFADACGNQMDAYDVLDALDDTGLCLIRDGEGFASDARRWAVMVIAADPLDHDPAIESHWDEEAQGRDEADDRGHRHRFEEEDP